jgi:hypothetical protein
MDPACRLLVSFPRIHCLARRYLLCSIGVGHECIFHLVEIDDPTIRSYSSECILRRNEQIQRDIR